MLLRTLNFLKQRGRGRSLSRPHNSPRAGGEASLPSLPQPRSPFPTVDQHTPSSHITTPHPPPFPTSPCAQLCPCARACTAVVISCAALDGLLCGHTGVHLRGNTDCKQKYIS